MLKLVPVPVFQLAPPFRLYCQLTASPANVTFTALSLVISSVPLLPVSLLSTNVGAAGAVESSCHCAEFPAAVLTLPATSVWRTWIAFPA